MHVVHMRKRHETMQRRIDRSGARIEVEGAMQQEADHPVFVLHSLVEPLQGFQLVEIKRGETIELDRPDIAAGTLYPHDADLFAAQRVRFHHLGRGVAAAVIGDALVGAEEI
jgi:hypothetical protein